MFLYRKLQRCFKQHLRYRIPKEIPVIFDNGSNYDYHFIMKKLAKRFVREFNFLEEKNSKVQILFSTNKKKREKRIGKNEPESTKIISPNLEFTDSVGFMPISLTL